MGEKQAREVLTDSFFVNICIKLQRRKQGVILKGLKLKNSIKTYQKLEFLRVGLPGNTRHA